MKVNEGSQTLVQFKLRPDVITPENVHTNIFLSSMVDSPLDSLYYLIKSVFTPALRDAKSNSTVQTSLGELEQMIRAAGKKSTSVFHPRDEINFWRESANKPASKTNDVERAKYFLQVFDTVKTDFENLEK